MNEFIMPTNPVTPGSSINLNSSKENNPVFGGVSSDTPVANMGQLREVSPEFHDRLMRSLAETIMKRMRESMQRIKKLNRRGGR